MWEVKGSGLMTIDTNEKEPFTPSGGRGVYWNS
jgi:hypothetical protein